MANWFAVMVDRRVRCAKRSAVTRLLIDLLPDGDRVARTNGEPGKTRRG